MSVSDFKPALSYFKMQTDDKNFLIKRKTKIRLTVYLALSGLNMRKIPYVHDYLSDFVVSVSIFKQIGGKETVGIQQLFAEFKGEELTSDEDYTVSFEFDFSEDGDPYNFVDCYYFLIVTISDKPISTENLWDDIILNEVLRTKIPFRLEE
ncbi:TPA: hypothetical protein IAE01_002654 [Listeria monocytogenes]|uniref:hypothetical protein n=1 Tax=Listeria seeligeri TaxID=1640 RepID=UPI001888E009|nr:hypothetical protein [Listeria seeligeri]MBF2623686.1 hypothetical protein [Listeria seeligeri]HAM2152017.1 hypothetical protein [Listeria monocytogenes]